MCRPRYTDLGKRPGIEAGSSNLTTGQLGVTARTISGGTTYYTRDPQGRVLGQHCTAGTGYYYTERTGAGTRPGRLVLVRADGARRHP